MADGTNGTGSIFVACCLSGPRVRPGPLCTRRTSGQGASESGGETVAEKWIWKWKPRGGMDQKFQAGTAGHRNDGDANTGARPELTSSGSSTMSLTAGVFSVDNNRNDVLPSRFPLPIKSPSNYFLHPACLQQLF